MGRMYVLDRTGHTQVEWEAGDPGTESAARREFVALRTCGYLPFRKRRSTSPPEQIAEFDAAAEEIFWVRPLAGG